MAIRLGDLLQGVETALLLTRSQIQISRGPLFSPDRVGSSLTSGPLLGFSVDSTVIDVQLWHETLERLTFAVLSNPCNDFMPTSGSGSDKLAVFLLTVVVGGRVLLVALPLAAIALCWVAFEIYRKKRRVDAKWRFRFSVAALMLCLSPFVAVACILLWVRFG